MTQRRSQTLTRILRRLGVLAFELTPQLFAIASFMLGGIMLLSAVTPEFHERLNILDHWADPLLIDLSHFAASVTGFLLLFVSAGLWRRRRGAYYAALLGLIGGALFSVLKGLNYIQAVEMLLAALLMWPCRAAFNRRSRLGEPLRPGWLLMLAASVLAMIWLGFFAYREVPYRDDLWWTFLTDSQASGFLRAAVILSLLTLVVAFRSLLTAPGARSHGPASAQDVERARQALEQAEVATPEARLALLGDKALLFSPSGYTFLAYRVRGRRWIAMSEPAGLVCERMELLWSFAELADSYGGSPVFYSVSESLLAELATMGLAVRKVGEAAVIPTHSFSTEGKGKQNLRTAVNRAERAGSQFSVLLPGEAAAVAEELRAVSDAWISNTEGSEKEFSLGRFDIDYLNQSPIAVVREDGRMVAFANLLMGAGNKEAMIDLMRYVPDGPHGVMDYLFTRTAQWCRETGIDHLDLGMAPLSGLEDRRTSPVFARVGALIFEEANAIYGFQGLRSYKAKFGPNWRPKFIAAPTTTPLPLALLDVALLTSKGWRGLLGLRK
ncbi:MULTISPECIES: phosphatidylglycerol lysyltransferase domain-containing protein [unclassified Brevundimonas]|uniref:phosphatidylglycerol lysyltransferase domain-containing protein n=1 Tax=unclassified Brevundimonas TaxID=2622653 RepID=UPI0025BFE63B|nr:MULTISPECIES: phosphatidylglycerol lysyltransferase domain-containing protein [unclassified Brevundimonas]